MPLAQYLIDRGEDINVQDVDGKTPLMKACISKHFELAQMLLELGANVQIEDENGENAAFFIKNNHLWQIEEEDLVYRVFTTLLDTKKIDVNKPNKFGETLFLHACSSAHLDIVIFLIDNVINCKIDSAFIERSMVYEDLEICECLIDNAAELLDLKDIDKPYTYANSEFGSLLEEIFLRETNEELIQLLYKKGYLKDICLNRLFLLAVSSGSSKLVKYFLKKGADVNHCDENGNSALILRTKSSSENSY
jgi:ankyrin repeat protein